MSRVATEVERKRPLVIVGGGPAGIAATTEAARAGMRCTLIDESPELGGQIYRRPPQSFRIRDARVLGKDFERGDRLRAELAQVSDRVERIAGTVLGIWGARDLVCSTGDGRTLDVAAERLILATGARDRPVPFPGWTLPGVLTAGGAQVLVKTMRIRPGRRAIVSGTGPLLLVVAKQLHEAGVEVVAVLEAGRPRFTPASLAKVWGEWGLLSDAWSYWRALRRARIPLRFDHAVFEALGEDGVSAVTWGPLDEDWRPLRARARRDEVDLVVTGFGFVPNTELTELAGCRHRFAEELGGWVPERDECMRTSVPGVLAAGDGCGVAGSLVAVEEGRVAGITAAEEAGALSGAEAERRRAAPLRRLRSLAGVRAVLDEMSRIRPGFIQLATPTTLACRCEEVTVEQVGTAVAEGARDLQAVKLFTRLGMGACQGRNCEPSCAAIVATITGCELAAAGRIAARPPVKPVTLGELASSPAEAAG